MTHRAFSSVLTLAMVGLALPLLACGASKDKLKKSEARASGLQKELDSTRTTLHKRKESLDVCRDDLKKAEARARAALRRADQSERNLRAVKKDFAKKMKASEKEVEALAKARIQVEERERLLKDLAGKLRPLINKHQIALRIVHGRMVIKMRSRVLFTSGSAKLLGYGKRTLARIAKVLKTVKGSHFQVAGHTDNVAIKKGDFKDNWELSTARALTVVKYLQGKGVDGAALSAAGFAEYQPVARNRTAWGRQVNRRIEITLLPQITRKLLAPPTKHRRRRKR